MTAETWDPWAYVEERHPDVQVVVMALEGRLQGCVDLRRRINWLADSLTPVQARCVLAFEIGRLQQGPKSDDPRVERAQKFAAQEWAALMLVSSEDFVAAWANCLDLSSMAARCGVDVPMFRARWRAASDSDLDAWLEAVQTPI